MNNVDIQFECLSITDKPKIKLRLKPQTQQTINKDIITALFNRNVFGKCPNLSKYSSSHDGREGHWLESMMNIKHNCINGPDILGYEMKKLSDKITFGDFSADEYIYSCHKTYLKPQYEHISSREEFIKYFGTFKDKTKRWSWSGTCVPKFGQFNDCGQKIIIDEHNNINIIYNRQYDKRNPELNIFDNDDIVIAVWSSLREKINNKFGKNGFFICHKNSQGIYDKITFGPPITYEMFLNGVKQHKIYFDSGMYIGNSRNYSQWRADKSYWLSLCEH